MRAAAPEAGASGEPAAAVSDVQTISIIAPQDMVRGETMQADLPDGRSFRLVSPIDVCAGQKVAAKRGDRETSEGAVLASANAAGDFGVLVSLNCETDFVAKNEEFVGVATNIMNVALEGGITDKAALLAAGYPGEGISIEEKITEQIARRLAETNFEL